MNGEWSNEWGVEDILSLCPSIYLSNPRSLSISTLIR